MGSDDVKGGELVKRHRISTRIWHWINAIAVIAMLMSGLTISNAHPHLYWGEFGANFDQPWYSPPHFPAWATIPSGYNLALARIWHLAFAWVLAFGLLAYLVASLITRHIQRDLTLTRAEIAPSHLWADIKDHARLRFPTGAAALRYNVLQKLTYIAVIFILIPLLILTGLGLSPGFNAILPIPDLFGGRATTRSIHFICAGGIALFILVHLLLVALAGPYNEIRSMITGRYRIPPDPAPAGEPT
ncbi:cytochrome b/b6 domain-containing protein [Sphingomonas sp.]|uniref:cytochrome b/b6 domain-containing protein n=1 Tax=Sphingomonas sp. TaxID=28214 RepID=UPI0025CECB1F|nr:cytochrome b/b6 domain-containing protein [Sphingomonas sp.]